MVGIKEFTQEVNGVSEIQNELKKMNSDSKRNYIIGLTGAITGVLGLIVAIVALFKS
ncbi:hypothetical protein [Cohnella abietis]|uniref:Uncharacterized protein n=1 Tax=Cohnella abietis TaxID=2507935 RepID=A0A3T1D4A1_9BACL|nr:hypothetical protein [Cohnella abietis]BBI32924.1 hypothetical protein KCTCHS21_23230 [Cohnella abietis]